MYLEWFSINGAATFLREFINFFNQQEEIDENGSQNRQWARQFNLLPKT